MHLALALPAFYSERLCIHFRQWRSLLESQVLIPFNMTPVILPSCISSRVPSSLLEHSCSFLQCIPFAQYSIVIKRL